MSPSKPRLFEYKGQWIGTESGRPGFYRYWFEGRNTRRRKLSAGELDKAKAELVSIVESAPASAYAPELVMFATVAKSYRKRVLKAKRKLWTDRKTGEERESISSTESGFNLTIKRLTEFMESPTHDGKPRSPNKRAFCVAELTLTTQQAFWRYLAANHGLSPKAISIYMATVSAAVNKAAEPYIDAVDGREREVWILTHAVPIYAEEKRISAALGLQPGPKHKKAALTVPTFREMAKVIDSIPKHHEHAFRYAVIALNTWARPEAVHELNFFEQVDFEYGLVHLNPHGREQTKKVRATIRLTDNLRQWSSYWALEYPIQWRGTRCKSAKKPIKSAFAAAGMDLRSRYDFRSFMPTHARRITLPGGRRMDNEQKSIWLGHKLGSGSSTSDYYIELDPDYLQEAKEATDAIMLEIDSHMKKRRLIAPTVETKAGLTIYSGGKT